jgi:hypothetical protein
MKDFTAEDRRHREALEKQSPSGARANMVATLNALSGIHGAKEAPPLAALNAIRKAQRLAARSSFAHNAAHAAYERKPENLDRLHPSSRQG